MKKQQEPSGWSLRANVSVHARARTDRVAVAVNVVNPSNRRPEFVVAQILGRVGGPLPSIRSLPLIADQHLRSMRSIFQQIIFWVGFARFDFLNLFMNGNHGV